jgi:serine/threonine protein kinase
MKTEHDSVLKHLIMVTTSLLKEEFWPGDELGNYRLLERIGAGGEGSVWSAWDTENQRVVAVKFFPPEQTQFKSEKAGPRTGFLQLLDHANIRKIYEVGDSGKFKYFSMPYYPSGSLDDLLISGALSVKDTFIITAQIVSALEYIHAQNIVHRDLKPTNILLDAEKRVYLTDFGIARKLSDSTLAYHTGHGTFRYSPPEQHTEAAISRQSDIYSLGLIVFEMLTGTLPWSGDVALAIKQLDTNEGIPDPQEINLNLPSGLVHALRKLTDMDPKNRPSTAAEAYGLIVAALNKQPLDAVTHEWGEIALDQTLQSISLEPDLKALALKEAHKLLRASLANWAAGTQRFNLHITQFAYLDSVFTSDGLSEAGLDDSGRQFMARGALVYDFNHKFWWERLGDPQAQIQLCEQVIENEEDEAISRLLTLILEEPPQTKLREFLSPSMISRLIDIVAGDAEPGLQMRAFDFIEQAVDNRERGWTPVSFSIADDTKLGQLALENSPQGFQAARLIGSVGSETAVNVLWEAMETENSRGSFTALVEVLRVARSLPSVIPGHVRRIAWGKLTRKQLISDRANLSRAYLFAALGAALGIGYTIFATYRLPSFLDTARILNSLGGGLFFGPLIGLGIFLTRLIVHRLRHTPPVPRVVMGILAGGIIVNLSFYGYHVLFLDDYPRGWLISFGAFVMITGFGLSAELFSSRITRALLSALTTALGLGLSWLWSMRLLLTPMIYYESEQRVASLLHISITALIVGIIPYLVQSLDLDDQVE